MVHVQSLETRRLLSIAMGGAVTFHDHTIFVTGTNAGDVVEFEGGRTTMAVRINGALTRFKTADVNDIEIRTLGGADRIVMGGSVKIGARIFAGDGNDLVSGSLGNDTIFGEGGNDTLTGRDGDDYLDAGRGDDTVKDWLGRNVVHGGAGYDRGDVDAALLGSGVESRRVVHPREGVVTPYDIYEIRHGEQGSGTYFIRSNGRVFLEYLGATGSGSNQVEFSDLRRRGDGMWEVSMIITTPGYGFGGTCDMKYFTKRWNVPDAARDGLVFTNKTIVPGSEQHGVATKTTTLSSTLLMPADNASQPMMRR